MNADLYFIDKIGLRDHLSPTRSNGLLSMVKQIRMYALAFKAKEGIRDNSREYPNREWGYGRLCLKNTLDLLKK